MWAKERARIRDSLGPIGSGVQQNALSPSNANKMYAIQYPSQCSSVYHLAMFYTLAGHHCSANDERSARGGQRGESGDMRGTQFTRLQGVHDHKGRQGSTQDPQGLDTLITALQVVKGKGTRSWDEG